MNIENNYKSSTLTDRSDFMTAFWLAENIKKMNDVISFPYVPLLRIEESRLLSIMSKADWSVKEETSKEKDTNKLNMAVIEASEFLDQRIRTVERELARDHEHQKSNRLLKVKYSLAVIRKWFDDEEMSYVPNLLDMDDDIANNCNKGTISWFDSRAMIKKYKCIYEPVIKQVNKDYDTSVKPILEEYISPESLRAAHKKSPFVDLYLLHQKYTLLWAYHNVFKNRKKNISHGRALKTLLISQKTRSGKSFIIPAFAVLYYHHMVGLEKQQINIFITGYFPATFDQILNNHDVFDNIPIQKINILDTDIKSKLLDCGINLIKGSHSAMHDRSREIYEITEKEENEYQESLAQDDDKLKCENIHIDLLIEDEAHVGTYAKKTKSNISKLRAELCIYLTATPNKNELFAHSRVEHSYMEEQFYKKVMKISDYKKYPDMIMEWVSSDNFPFFDKMYELAVKNGAHTINNRYDPSKCLAGHRNEKYKKEKSHAHSLYHEEDGLMNELVNTLINIHMTKNPKWRKKFIVAVKTFLLNNNSIVSNLFASMIDIFKTIKKSDIPSTDTILKVGSKAAADKLEELLIKNPIVNEHFRVIKLYSSMKRADRYVREDGTLIGSVNQLEAETSTADNRPRFIILCDMGTTGATFNNVDAVVILCNIRSQASYIQTVERGGSPLKSGRKRFYHVFDYDKNRMVNFLGAIGTKKIIEYTSIVTFRNFWKLMLENDIHSDIEFKVYCKQYNNTAGSKNKVKLPKSPWTYSTFREWGNDAWKILHGEMQVPRITQTKWEIAGDTSNLLMIAKSSKKLQSSYFYEQLSNKKLGNNSSRYSGLTDEEVFEKFVGSANREISMDFEL